MSKRVYFYKSFLNPQKDEYEIIELCRKCAATYKKDGYVLEQIDLAGKNDFCIDCGVENTG